MVVIENIDSFTREKQLKLKFILFFLFSNFKDLYIVNALTYSKQICTISRTLDNNLMSYTVLYNL